VPNFPGLPQPEKPALILVEGTEDQGLVDEVARLEGLHGIIQVIRYAEVGKLGDVLDVLVRDSQFSIVQRVGLTRDADNGFEPARQSLIAAWARGQAALQLINRAEPQCFFFAFPDNKSHGRIENLCLASPRFPGILECAEQMRECATSVASYEIDNEKSLVAAYLSMMEQAGVSLQVGAQAGYWDLEAEVYAPLREFVRNVGGGL
jgi:hypothetical protein